MKLENLKEQIYKNYKELCICIGEPIKQGKSKILQLEDFKRFFNYEKEGNKYFIKEIYTEPKEKIDNRVNNGGNNTSVYGDEFVNCLMDLLQRNNYKFEGTAQQLLLQCRVIKKKFNDYRFNKDNFITEFKIEKKDIELFDKFVDILSLKLNNLVKASLDKLEKLNMIKYSKSYMIAVNGFVIDDKKEKKQHLEFLSVEWLGNIESYIEETLEKFDKKQKDDEEDNKMSYYKYTSKTWKQRENEVLKVINELIDNNFDKYNEYLSSANFKVYKFQKQNEKDKPDYIAFFYPCYHIDSLIEEEIDYTFDWTNVNKVDKKIIVKRINFHTL